MFFWPRCKQTDRQTNFFHMTLLTVEGIMKNHLKYQEKVYQQIIQIWLLHTTTLEICMTTWASTRKHWNIMKKSLPADHPNLATSYSNIGSVYNNLGKHSKALEYLKQALNILKKSLPASHPNIVKVAEHIEVVKMKL